MSLVFAVQKIAYLPVWPIRQNHVLPRALHQGRLGGAIGLWISACPLPRQHSIQAVERLGRAVGLLNDQVGFEVEYVVVTSLERGGAHCRCADVRVLCMNQA